MSVVDSAVATSKWAWGQCTYYMGELFNIPWSGNAKDWATGAAASGWEVTQTPAVGDIAVFQPGADGALSPYGHVALVTDVGSGNQFSIKEMNATAGLDRIDSRIVQDVPGVSFIVPPASADNVAALTSALGTTPPNMLNGAGPNIPATTTASSSQQAPPGIIGTVLGALGFTGIGEFFVRAGLVIMGLILFVVGLKLAFAAQAETIINQGAGSSGSSSDSEGDGDTGFGARGKAKVASTPRPPHVPRPPKVARDAAVVAE